MNLSAQSDKTNNNKANPWLRPTETLFTGMTSFHGVLFLMRFSISNKT